MTLKRRSPGSFRGINLEDVVSGPLVVGIIGDVIRDIFAVHDPETGQTTYHDGFPVEGQPGIYRSELGARKNRPPR